MRQRPPFEPIPELLRPQNCAGYIVPTALLPRACGDPCPEPAAWFSTATGKPYCEGHMLTLKAAAHETEITPP
jgi:hypothetical protein